MLTLEIVLAWNGGGKSNYTDIIKDGSYKVGPKLVDELTDKVGSLKAELESLVHDLEELIAKA